MRLIRQYGWRAALATVGAGLVIATVLHQLAPGSRGPNGSSYAASSTGVSGYATLLSRAGHRVTRLRRAPGAASLPARATVVMLAPTVIVRPDLAALDRYVTAGGTLIVGAAAAPTWLGALLPDPPQWVPAGSRLSRPLLPTDLSAGVREVQSAGQGAWSDAGQTLPVLGAADGSLITVASLGTGRIILLSDPSPLENGWLARADNAALGLALAGPRTRSVIFDEAAHGYGEGNGLAGLPARWKWALIGLALAALLAVAARFRRLAPPAPPGPRMLPPRREHVEAVAAALARTRHPETAAAPVAGRARQRLLERTGLSDDADPDAVIAAGSRLGLDPDEARTIAPPDAVPADDADVLAAGRALAKLSGPAR